MFAGLLFFGVVFNILLYILSHSRKSGFDNTSNLLLEAKDYIILGLHLFFRIILIFRA